MLPYSYTLNNLKSYSLLEIQPLYSVLLFSFLMYILRGGGTAPCSSFSFNYILMYYFKRNKTRIESYSSSFLFFYWNFLQSYAVFEKKIVRIESFYFLFLCYLFFHSYIILKEIVYSNRKCYSSVPLLLIKFLLFFFFFHSYTILN